MVLIIDEDEAEEILKQSKVGRYFILGNVKIGEAVNIEFLSGIGKVDQGDEDIAGRIWNNDWTKYEAKARVNNIDTVISLGGSRNPGLLSLLEARRENNVPFSEIAGSKWRLTRVDTYEFEWKYLGKEGQSSDVNILKDAINSLKEEGVFKEGQEIDEDSLLVSLAIRSHLDRDIVKDNIDKLELKKKNGKYIIK